MFLNCDDQETRNYSYQYFLEQNTLKDFLIAWASFYDNNICIPTYYDTFYDNNGDNPQATKLMGEKFKQITLKGVIITNSQVSIPYNQKGYIQAYVPNHRVKQLNDYLNRYIVSFYVPLNEDNPGVRGLYVTYDGEEKLSQMIKFTQGIAFSQVGSTDDGSIIQIRRWLNKNLQKI